MIDCRKIDVEEKKSESESERTEGKEITNRGTRSFYDAGKLLRKVLFKFRTPSSFIFKLYPFAFVLSKLHAHSFLYTYIFTLQRSLVSTWNFFLCVCTYIYIYTHTHTIVFNLLERSRRKNGPVHFGFTWHARKISPLHPMNFLFISLSLPMENLSIRVNRQNGEHKKYKKNRQYLYSISLSLSNYRRWITDLDEPR